MDYDCLLDAAKKNFISLKHAIILIVSYTRLVCQFYSTKIRFCRFGQKRFHAWLVMGNTYNDTII